MATATMRIERAHASAKNQEAVIRLIDEASSWLRTKNNDQWARPWPPEKKHNRRIRRGLRKKQTWIVWDGMTPAATVTIAEKPIRKVWPTAARDQSIRAVYVYRLVTARKYAGCKLGEQLIDWAGRRGRDSIGAQWIRIDVWSSNTALHEYYERQGFVRCGQCPDPDYPSGALFQKPIDQIGHVRIPRWPGPVATFTMEILETSAEIGAPVPA